MMKAIFVNNCNDRSDLTAKDVFDVFFKTWSPSLVHEKLWEVFRLAVNGCLEKEKVISVEDVALLFDQLTDLISAAHALYLADIEELKHQEGTAYD